jgi:hypothetical protein
MVQRNENWTSSFLILKMTVTKWQEKYAKHDFHYRDYQQAFVKASIPIRFPKAHEVLFEMTDRMNDVYKGMLLAAGQDNLTSNYILYRSLIDHFIKIQYILDKTATGLSDQTAEQYQVHYFISEALGEQGGIMQMEALISDSPEKLDLIAFLRAKYPEMKEFEKANQQELSAAVGQFNLKSMIKHLMDRYRTIGSAGIVNVFAKTLPEFAQISSFTHAGPYAGKILQMLEETEKCQERLNDQLHIGLSMLGMCKENNFIMYEIDASFKEVLLQFQSLRSN